MRVASFLFVATVAATTGQAATMFPYTFSVTFYGVVDHVGTLGPPGIQVGDSMWGTLTARTTAIDPGTMNIQTHGWNCWMHDAITPGCATPAGTYYQMVSGFLYFPKWDPIYLLGADGASMTVTAGIPTGASACMSAYTCAGAGNIPGNYGMWHASPNYEPNPTGGRILAAYFVQSPEPGSIALMAGGLLALGVSRAAGGFRSRAR